MIRVEAATDEAKKQGLQDGDVFVRLGPVEFPSIAAGVREIRAAAGRTIESTVRRTVDGRAAGRETDAAGVSCGHDRIRRG